MTEIKLTEIKTCRNREDIGEKGRDGMRGEK